MIPGISISFQGVVALRLFNSLTKQRTLLSFTTTYLNCIEPLQRLSYPYPISPSPPPFFFSTEHDAVSSSVLRAYLTLLDYLVGRVLMPTASAGTVMRGHDNRVGSIPGISMPPNHRFSTYRLSPPPSAVYSIRDLLPVITTTFRRSSSSYPRQRERESLHGDERKKDDRWPLSPPPYRYFRSCSHRRSRVHARRFRERVATGADDDR